ncbi:hypothetical protein ACFMJ1_21465 [Acinetobacter baumannii]
MGLGFNGRSFCQWYDPTFTAQTTMVRVLDVWARETLENNSSVAQKQADYERDKQQCKEAIENPNLGNTSPK